MNDFQELKTSRARPSLHPLSKAADLVATEDLRAEILAKIDGAQSPDKPPTKEAAASIDDAPKRRGKDKGPRRRRRKPGHDDLVDNAREALQRRPFKRLETAEEAIVQWKAARLYARQKDPLPRLERPPTEGEPYEVMVAILVEDTPGFAEWRAGTLDPESFLAAIEVQLPQDIPLPWGGLCGAEREAMGAELKARLASEGMPEPIEATRPVEDRLLPGFRRSE